MCCIYWFFKLREKYSENKTQKATIFVRYFLGGSIILIFSNHFVHESGYPAPLNFGWCISITSWSADPVASNHWCHIDIFIWHQCFTPVRKKAYRGSRQKIGASSLHFNKIFKFHWLKWPACFIWYECVKHFAYSLAKSQTVKVAQLRFVLN